MLLRKGLRLLVELRRLTCWLLVKLRLLLPNSFLRINFSLYGYFEDLWVKGEKLFDGKLLDIRGRGEELVVGVLLLLQIKVGKLLQELLLIFFT